MTIFLEATP